jgi:Cdc6-like AAA superfamily ATPase
VVVFVSLNSGFFSKFRYPDHRLDIPGVPGTGKTATVHAVVRELKRMAESNVCSLGVGHSGTCEQLMRITHRKQARSLTSKSMG